MAGLVGQPLPQNLWKNLRHTWLKLAAAERSEAEGAISITPPAPGHEQTPGIKISEDGITDAPYAQEADWTPPTTGT